MNPLEVMALVSGVLELAEKAPDFVKGKVFISPDLARELGVVDCLPCSDSGFVILDGEHIGCPDCDA